MITSSAIRSVELEEFVRGGARYVSGQTKADYIAVKSEIELSDLTPLFFSGSIASRFNELFHEATRKVHAIGCYRIRPALVAGRGVVFCDHNTIVTSDHLNWSSDTFRHRRWKIEKSIWNEGLQLFLQSSLLRRVEEPAVLLMRRGDHIYGHWLLDILPLIAVVRRCNLSFPKFIISKHTPDFAKDLLGAIGIKPNEVIEIDEDREVLECSELYLPTPCRYLSSLSPISNDTFSMLNDYGSQTTVNAPERLYLSRSHISNNKRRLVNTEEVERVLEDYGFRAFVPERYPLAEQIAAFRDASAIFGESGSALHNSLFSKEGIRVGSMLGNHVGIFIQSSVGRLKDQPTGYLFGESFHRPGNSINGDYIICTEALSEVLERHFS